MADAGKIVITPKGAYSSTKTYEWLDEVSYNGNAYVALKTVTGVTPSDDGVNWRLFMSSADVDANVLVPKFTEASTRSNIVSGENLSTMFGKIKKWFTDLKSHAFKDLVNNLTTSTTGSALDASQGKILKDEVDGVNRNLTKLELSDVAGGKNILDYTSIGENFSTNATGTSFSFSNGEYVITRVNNFNSGIYTYSSLLNVLDGKKIRLSFDAKTDTSGMSIRFCVGNGNGYVTKELTEEYKRYASDFNITTGVPLIFYGNDLAGNMYIKNIMFEDITNSESVDSTYEPHIPSVKMLTKDVDSVKNDLSTHTHNYAGSDTPGGSATYALQANKDGAGNVIDATYINKTYMRNYGAGSIAFGNNMFIGIFNGDIICSSDGQEWEVNFEPNLFSLLDNDEILLGITYGNEKFVSFSNKGCSYVSSDNGNTWTKTQTIITV